jgi:ABC-type polysaccharide/polyol phosphate transport system ATPase subunit
VASAAYAALKDISFSASEGDRIGIVGANGAGKTTLLRVLAGIYLPDQGTVEVLGRILPFFGHFPGVNPDATGYENIKLSAYSMGMPPRSIPALIADIEEFTELGEFLSMPLRSYSTGMSTKLLFSIATALTADVFVLDEFSFATGDRFFKERAMQRSHSLIGRAKVVFLASHDESIVRTVCNKAIFLRHGQLVAFGQTEDILKEYNQHGAEP